MGMELDYNVKEHLFHYINNLINHLHKANNKIKNYIQENHKVQLGMEEIYNHKE